MHKDGLKTIPYLAKWYIYKWAACKFSEIELWLFDSMNYNWYMKIKWKTENTTQSEQFQDPIKIRRKWQNQYLNTQIHDRLLSRLGTNIAIKKKHQN
jgi:hypothetical protein